MRKTSWIAVLSFACLLATPAAIGQNHGPQDPTAPRTPGDPGGDKFFSKKDKKKRKHKRRGRRNVEFMERIAEAVEFGGSNLMPAPYKALYHVHAHFAKTYKT